MKFGMRVVFHQTTTRAKYQPTQISTYICQKIQVLPIKSIKIIIPQNMGQGFVGTLYITIVLMIDHYAKNVIR